MRRPATHCPAGRYQRLHGRFPLMPAADVHGYSGAGAQDGRCEGVAPARGGRFAVFCAIAVVVAPAAGSAAEVRPRQPARITAAPGKPMPAAGPRAVADGTRSDPAVTPAGGVHAGPCGHCRRNACPQCRIPDAGNALVHGPCHHGLCPAHCPVRPDVFGFYGTQWRKWPGSGVIQASNQDEATPARPPKAEVPEATEESLQQPSDGQPPQAPATDGPATDDAMDDREDAAPADRGKAGGKPAPAPLPQPFPGADDGAADRRRIGRRWSG